MKVRAFDPVKLDVELFAREGAELKGVWRAAELQRLAADAAPEAPASGWPDISWLARGERRESRGSEPQIWLHLQANATVALTCQRCLQPVRAAVKLQRDFRFVRDEQTAAEIDAESVEDVLAANQAPSLFLPPLAGVWLDRYDRHKVLIVVQVLAMAQSLAMAALTLTDHITIPCGSSAWPSSRGS